MSYLFEIINKMLTIKPTSAKVYLNYTCPKCSMEHQVSYEEVSYPGGVLCFCGQKLKFEPMTLKVKLHYTNDGPKETVRGVLPNPIRLGESQGSNQMLINSDKAQLVVELLKNPTALGQPFVNNPMLEETINRFKLTYIKCLMNLGFSRKEANDRLDKVDIVGKTEEQIIKECFL